MASASGREVAGGMEAEVLRLMHGDLIEHMNSKLMVETLWRKEVVSLDVKKNIMRSSSVREGNRTLLRVLLQNVSITRFQRFLEVLEHSTDDHAPLILRFNNELAGLKGHPETLDVAVERRTPDIVKTLNNHYFSLIVTDPFLQAPMNTFIPLQLVEAEGDHEGRDQSCVPLLAREGGEYLAANNTLIDYDDILNYPVYDRSKKFIMIVGERGSGKSTLARKMCWDFTSRVWGTEFVMVILVKCNQLPNRQGLQLEDLLAPLVGQTNQLVGQLAQYIKGRRNERILFILDGFDEMSRELQHDSPVLDIIHGRLVSNASYIVLTDPSCAPHISHVTNRCLYLAGFSREGMRDFAQAYFKNVYTRNALVLTKALENRPRLRQILYKPECILSICFYLSGRGLPISITKTTLYLMVILANRHVELVLGQQSNIHEAEEIFEKCPSFKELGELALFGIKQNSTTFRDSDPSIPCNPAQLDHMGLLSSFGYRDVSGSTPEVFYFSNYGIHEYLAAYALTHNRSPVQQLEFWRKYFVNSFSPNGEFDIFEKRVSWCFLSYACQSGLRNEGIQQLLLETMDESFGPSITRSTPLVQLFDIANESQNVEFCRKVLHFVSPVVEIHTSRHGNPDLVDVHNYTSSLGWCLRHYHHLRGLHITAPHLKSLAELLGLLEDVSTVQEVVFTSINPSTAEDFDIVCKFLKNQRKITCLKLDNVCLQSMELSLLGPVIAQHSLHLEEVQLRGTGDGSSSSLSEVMSHLLKCDKLRSLSLGSLEVGCNEIEQVLVRLSHLQELRIFDILSQDVNILNAAPTVDSLRRAVSRHPNLLTLDVGRSSEMMVKGLMEGISEGTALRSLTIRVSVNYLHSCIAQCLRRGYLRTLHLSVVYLTSTSEFMDLLSALPASPVENLTLAMILTDNEVSKDLAPCIERCLEQCVSLRRLSIQTSSNLSPVFCKALLRGAMTCNNLQHLELLGINFGHGDIVETLATYVRSCKVKRLAVGSKDQPCSGLFPRQIGYILAEGLLGNTLEECAIYASNEFRAEPDLKSSRYEDISQGLRSNRVIHRLVVACPKMALTNVAKGVLDGVELSSDLPLRFLHLHLGEAVPENNLGRLKGHRKLESYIVCSPRSR